MSLIIKACKRGTPHPSPYLWGSLYDSGTRDATMRVARERLNQLKTMGKDTKDFITTYGNKATNLLARDALVICWDDSPSVVENEFGVECP